jgi:hypothetical protein
MKADKAMEKKLRENERYVEKLVRGLKRTVKKAGVEEFEFETLDVAWNVGLIGKVFARFDEGDKISAVELFKIIEVDFKNAIKVPLVDRLIDWYVKEYLCEEWDCCDEEDYAETDVVYREFSEEIDERAGIVDYHVGRNGEIEINAKFRDGEWGWISEEVVLVPVLREK